MATAAAVSKRRAHVDLGAIPAEKKTTRVQLAAIPASTLKDLDDTAKDFRGKPVG